MHWSGIYLNYKDTPHEDLNAYPIHLSSDKNFIKKEGLRDRQNHRWKTLEDNLNKNKKNTILEFGGDIGHSWQSLTDVYNMDYYIVERKTLSDHGNKVFGTNNFYDHVPTLEKLEIDHNCIVRTETAKDYL